MKIQHILNESFDAEAIKAWMAKHDLDDDEYEIHDDGTVTINSNWFQNMILGSPDHPIPFRAIRELNGSIYIKCKNKSSSNLHKFLQTANNGTVTVEIDEPSPLLSLAKIKGSAELHLYIWGTNKKGEYGKMLKFGNKLSNKLNQAKSGQLDLFELQDELIDSGYKEYARL